MAETNATILIPDISGFTEFMTSSELGHASRAINILIDTIINAVGDEYEVLEIEGDAVLMIKKGPPPPKKEILNICLSIFNAFHFQRKWMIQHIICPCGACQAVGDLTLKFVVHHGPLAEIKVGRFVTHSGMEMIVAHRLLKNSIDSHEYLLITEKLIQQMVDSAESADMDWEYLSEEYASIGKVGYQFARLNEARKKVPDPAKPRTAYQSDDTLFTEIPIAADFRDVYMAIMNIPGRPNWWPVLKNVEQDMPDVLVGSMHRCTFDDYNAIVSPLKMIFSGEEIIYAESCRIDQANVSLVYEYVFKKIEENTSSFACRFMNVGELPVPEKLSAALLQGIEQMTESLKVYCETTRESLFSTPSRV